MNVPRIFRAALTASLLTSCITPAYRDEDFFLEDRSLQRYGEQDPYDDLRDARGPREDMGTSDFPRHR